MISSIGHKGAHEMKSWYIGVSSWILMDGNHETVDFEVGAIARFAVEFYLPKYSVSLEPVGLTPARRCYAYEAVGESIFQNEEVWVLGLGDISAFRTHITSDVKIGQRVSGELDLGIDPFFYYESLYKVPEIPPLIYEWRIEGILLDTTPLIKTIDKSGQQVWTKDEARIGYVPVDRIDLGSPLHKGTIGNHLLCCSKFDTPPAREI